MENKKLNKKAQFSTSAFVISMLLFSGIVAFFVIAIASMENNYPDADLTSETFSENYDELTAISEDVEIMRSTASSGEGFDFRGAFDVTFGSFFTVVQLVLSGLGLFGSLGSNIATDFPFLNAGVINIFAILGLGILTTVIVFKIVNAVGRNRV